MGEIIIILILIINGVVGFTIYGVIYGVYLAHKRQKEIDKWKKKYKTF